MASRKPRNPRSSTAGQVRASLSLTGLKLGSLISVNVGGASRTGRGRNRGGLTRFLTALKGANYSRTARTGPTSPRTRTGGGGGGFDRFRSSRPDLFDPEDDTDTEDDTGAEAGPEDTDPTGGTRRARR
jgi:hypothetical protein